MTYRLSVTLEDGDRAKIEQKIKQKYPEIKTTSELVRAALRSYLGGS